MSAHRSFFRNAFDRLVEARMRQAEREVERHRGTSGTRAVTGTRHSIG